MRAVLLIPVHDARLDAVNRPRRFAANPRPVFGARRPIKRSAALIHSTALIWYNVNALKRTWKEARICR